MIYGIKGRPDNKMTIATDALDLVISIPVTALAPTAVILKSSDRQKIWASWTGAAGEANWETVVPYEGATLGIPPLATKLYIRKPLEPRSNAYDVDTGGKYAYPGTWPTGPAQKINKGIDPRQRLSDIGLRLQVSWIAYK